MFSGQISANSLNIFKWNWHSTSSLKTGLLKDVPQEIELSDYHKPPSPHSESPSGLLDCETSNVEPIDDLDLFIERIYTYYCEKGLWCIIFKWIFELLSLLFIICFSGFFLLFVDWNGLRNAKCGMDAVESGIKPCDLSEEALHKHPFTPFTLSKAIIVGYLGIFSIYWIFCFLRFFTQLKETLKIRQFFYNSLHVTDNEIKTMPWALILEKVIQVQSLQQLCVVKDLSIHDVVMRLMRKENYLIGMVNKGVLAFPISGWVPGAGPTFRVGLNGVQHRLVLTKTLEWTLNWCILQSMFDRNFCLRTEFVSDPKTLRKRLMIVGFAMLLLSPFLVIFMLVYLFLRHAEQFYNHPSTASHRRWSNLSKWMFREFNEVDHLFKHRINSSVVHASDYLKQFPSPILTIIAKFISFVSGGFAAVLIIIAFLEESLLEGHIFGRNLFWYAAVFGTITAISRAAMVDELLVLDPLGAMTRVVQHTHYMPKKWREKENTETVRAEFETLFQYSGMMLLEEMASIFITPYLLLFVVPKRVDDILQFIVDFTTNVEGVGHVCCFGVFNFKDHGNSKYGSPFNSPRIKRSSQGKMEKSALSFQISYPSWEPDAQGKHFLASIKAFRDQKLQGQGTRIAELASRMQQQSPNFGGFGGRNYNFSREMPFGNAVTDSMWLIDVEEKNFPYILDWYYTSRNHDRAGYTRDISFNTFADVEENPNDFRNASHSSKNEAKYCGNWRYLDVDRVQSHLEASTSSPLFQQSVLQHHNTSNAEHRPTGSHWWARSQPQGADPQTSFLDPPNFFHNAPHYNYDNFSEQSVEDQEDSEWRNRKRLSQSFFIDNLDGGEFSLPFDDIYESRPLERPTESADPSNLV
ncbi:autophagy-related protein 9-like isoform X2 [Olea europaea var. sylvestris]|uniref:autophagy-related protein 9-like isoform X2 n=1 Tax=Olea europaea var. sylvestris TaxID=158386 RepID=UPI000C1D367B|nr:autophagy-related protein 9-like isoform X2 [Olea europaea var. sylvestris]